ncbi:hypothetical protein BaRGS_00023180 [Batillaria attramentaria]|uniref:Protein THEM6 n=1 Tax=Batillaria attramentaria TaxID=370345 RepID=A0ABD0KEX8_9CAEN
MKQNKNVSKSDSPPFVDIDPRVRSDLLSFFQKEFQKLITCKEDMVLEWLYVGICTLFLWVLFDVNYFVRAISWGYIGLLIRNREPPGPFTTQCFGGVCLTSDLDFMFRMNSGRYLRECDFARFDFWIQSHVYKALKTLGATITNKAAYIQYRRSIRLMERFHTYTKLVFWDEKSFYLEQKMIRAKDNVICAVNYTCHTLTNPSVTPQDVLNKLYGRVECPPAPPDVAAWILLAELASRNT